MPTLTPDISANSQAYTALVSNLVHDLRQPLSVIDACADYLNLILPAVDNGARQQVELLQQQVGEANRILHEALLNLHYHDSAATSNDRVLTNAASSAVTY